MDALPEDFCSLQSLRAPLRLDVLAGVSRSLLADRSVTAFGVVPPLEHVVRDLDEITRADVFPLKIFEIEQAAEHFLGDVLSRDGVG